MIRTTWGSAGFMFAVCLFAKLAAGTEPATAKRLPIPAAESVTKARELIRDAYESDYGAAKNAGEYAGLLKKLRGFANAEADPVKKYAFLLEAEEVAADRDDAAATLETVDRRAALFEIDGLEERAKTLSRLATPRVAPDLALFKQAMDTATKAAAAERFDIAMTSAKLAIEVGKAIKRAQDGPRPKPLRMPAHGEVVPPGNGPALVKQAVDMQAQITKQRKLFDEYQEVKAILDSQPDDPAANAKAGTYLCLVTRNWELGLPHLKKAGTATLSDLAAEELALADPASAEAAKVFSLAGKWWNAQSESKRLVDGGGDATRDHAARLYAGLIGRLTDKEAKLTAVNRAGDLASTPVPIDIKDDPIPVECEEWNISLPPDAVIWERNGNAYKVFTGDHNAPWDGAKEQCAKMGGHLVFINSAEEQAFVRELLKAAGDRQRFLAGATNTSGDRKWRWGDSSLMSFTAWAADEPSKDNTQQLFLHLDTAAGGAWRGGPAASDHFGFVCEWERLANGKNVVVNPSFEDGAEPYWLRGEGTMIVKDKKVRSGEAACVLSSDGYAGIYQDVPVTWGDKITISFWAEPHLPLAHSGAEVHIGPEMWKGIGTSIRTERVENGWNQYTATMHIPAREAAPTLQPKTKVGIAIFMRGCKPVHADDFQVIVERGAAQEVAGKPPAGRQAFTSYRLVAKKSNANGWEAYYRTIELFDAGTGKPLTGGHATGTGTGAADAFDDDKATSYRSVMNPGVEGDWIAYKLPEPAAINRVRIIQWGGDGNHVYWLEIQGSNDGTNWTPIMSAKEVPDEFDSTDPKARVEWLAP